MSCLSSRFLSLLFLLPTFVVIANAQCYNVNGTELDSTYAPCKPASGDKHSGCCATNRAVGADVCLDSGLCMATVDKYVGTIWQNGCTDATWNDKGCPKKMCPNISDDFNGYDPVTSWNIQTCNYGSYCCRSATDKASCCSKSTAPMFINTFLGAIQFPTSTISTSAPSTATATTIPSPDLAALATSTPSPSPSDVCAKDKSMLVGGAVGGTLGAALIGLLGVILWIHKKEKRQRVLKEHYEAQFSKSWALRKGLARNSGSTVDTRGVVTLSEKEVQFSTSDYELGRD